MRQLIDVSERDEDESWLDTFSSTGDKPSPFEWELAGRPVFLLLIQSVGYFGLLCFLHGSSAWARQKGIGPGAALTRRAASIRGRRGGGGAHTEEEDEDVRAEADAVDAAEPGTYDVAIDGLVKAYRTRANGPGSSSSARGSPSENEDPSLLSDEPPRGSEGDRSQPASGDWSLTCGVRSGVRTRVAVDRLSLGIRRGERFGLLGVNGAGKSTTLKVLCGDHPPTAGSVTVCGLSVTGDLSKVQRVIGYCPQFDPLLELMTGRETARMYAMLKGVPARDADAAADAVLRSVGLRKFADRPCGTISIFISVWAIRLTSCFVHHRLIQPPARVWFPSRICSTTGAASPAASTCTSPRARATMRMPIRIPTTVRIPTQRRSRARTGRGDQTTCGTDRPSQCPVSVYFNSRMRD